MFGRSKARRKPNITKMTGNDMSSRASFSRNPISLTLAWLSFLCYLLFFPAATFAVASPPHIAQFTPQGTVKGVRQVTVRFSEPMVPLGDPRSVVDPFIISCPESGAARWADSVNWIYDFSRDLPAGVRCAFRLRDDLKSLVGKALTGQQEFFFSTGGPAVISHLPYERIEEDQAFVLFLDAEPTEASVSEHVSFSVEGLPERIGINLLSGDAREAILKTLYPEQRKGSIIVLQARQRFPNRTKVTLVWGTGVTSTSGVSTEQDQTVTFQVRDVFKATFQCERENKNADCIPLRPMQIGFSTPISRALAQQIVLIGPQGKRWSPEPGYENQELVSDVSFKGPFPEETIFRVELPAGVTDEAGRTLVNADSFPLQVKTGPFPPLAKFAARFGIVEWKADPALPVTIRKLEPETLVRSLRQTPKRSRHRGLQNKRASIGRDYRRAYGAFLRTIQKMYCRGCGRWRQQKERSQSLAIRRKAVRQKQ